MRRIVLFLLIALFLAALWLTQKSHPKAIAGWDAVSQLLADIQRQAESVPLALTRISDEDEIQIGNEIVKGYGYTHRVLKSPSAEIEAYLNRVGRKVARSVSRPSIPYRFYFDDNPELVDAFSLPGGHVIVGKGLLNLMQSEDELAVVLGHEIAHIDRRHCVERLQYEIAARKLHLEVPYWFASIPVAVFEAGYTKEHELEADRAGVVHAVYAGYSPAAFADLFGRIQQKYETVRQGATNPAQEAGQILASGLDEYFRSHPPTAERIAEIDREIRQHKWSSHPQQPLSPAVIQQDQTQTAQANCSDAVRITADMSEPVIIKKVDPPFPEAARKKQRYDGSPIIVEAIIDTTGSVICTMILRSEHDDLDPFVLDAISQWKYKPALKDGKPVAVYFTVTVFIDLK